MSQAKQILEKIIENFDIEKFSLFFREKSRDFAVHKEDYCQYNDELFADAQKLGEIKFSGSERFIVCAFKSVKELTERSSKKAQYEKAKKILKDGQIDAGIFIFYDANGNFRFSLVYPEPVGNRRIWSNFRRFTYFVNKEFTNKTFLDRIGKKDFSSIDKIKDAFSVEKVTKEFYESIANWYFWAVEHCQFPKDAEAEDNGRNIAVIRLITRMIFIWFMREQGLLPKSLFEEHTIVSILQNLSDEDTTYYTAILQNLFFATLSTRKEERQFGSDVKGYKGYNPDFDNQYVFRYQELFKNPEEIDKYFGDIPFLNGGLFECLDDKKNGIIIDGFSRVQKNQPVAPNFLFFSKEKKVDLNKAYGTNNKTYTVHGLLDILSSFNFTIDENTPDDADVALDPELLGRVFENLLASFNPETSTTARKATGSYYTPREIVDYMVTESLKAYFKTHLESIGNIDEKLENLFSTANQENPFDKPESKKLVDLIENVKIVDPAVGSGAFPMGALNKMVFILNKVDQGNELWKQAQLKVVDAIPDPSVRREAKNRIEEFFKGKNADYGRKLYLIQRCIYGVDIQQIAVEIAKLRFFISLLVDEKIDKTKDNWGIEPLPNLDFKIMQGNSLISEFLGIDFDKNPKEMLKEKINGLDSEIRQISSYLKIKEAEFINLLNKHGKKDENLLEEINSLANKKRNLEKERTQTQNELSSQNEQKEENLIKEFELKKIDFQNEPDKDRKAKLKTEVEDLMIRIFESKVKSQKAGYFKQLAEIEQKYAQLPNKQQRDEIIAQEKQKLSQKSGFDLDNIEKQLREFTSKKKTRPFFPWKLYFAEVFEKGGFDVVIGNPPYGADLNEKEKKFFKEHYISAKTIKGVQKGSLDTFTLFIESGFNCLKQFGNLNYIVPMAVTSSDSMTGLHNLLEQHCFNIKISSYSNRPKQVFDNACIRTSIMFFEKTNTKTEHVFTTKMIRRRYSDELETLIHGLQFIDSYKFKLQGRYPKISTKIEYDILEKMFQNGAPLERHISEEGNKIYYRTSGGRYFNVITNYETGSTKEKPLIFNKKLSDFVGASLTSNLFYFYQQVYTNGIDLKQYEIASFPIPKALDSKIVAHTMLLYGNYLKDIEKNANTRTATTYANIDSFKEYKIQKSKHLIDQIDDLICPLYGLTKEETEFIKNYEIEYRLSDTEEEE